ncbi:MAG: LysM peptidoglycan-binding domain-containing protein [Opitutae bacterium]|jgi:LysM repeat protein|nr:LysM peptidoglycan-binding domain-containing protein [Opitutae bacterium]MBT7855158.1 LysM peptidoglycan-binding domain-containing protein [Opitutae bacterium]
MKPMMSRPAVIVILILGCALLPMNDLQGTRYHIVRKGENLSYIAIKNGVSREAIIRANDIRNPNLIRIGKKLIIPEKGSNYLNYVVRKGDSLGEIATHYRTTISKLSQLNNLRDANSIRIGQKLKIPLTGSSGTSKPREESLLSTSLLKELKNIRVKNARWKGIVIHHSATTVGSAKGLDRYHKEQRKMQNGLAYHFVIGNGKGMRDGEIYIGNRWKNQLDGGHLKLEKWNKENIGICLIGNFQIHHPSQRQINSLEGLVRHLIKHCDIPSSEVTTHRLKHKNHTVCPGKHFSLKSLQSRLAR